jgi:WD40 repeat protein
MCALPSCQTGPMCWPAQAQVSTIIDRNKLLLSDQTVKIWLSGSGAQPLASYSGHAGSVNSVAIRPEGAAGAYSSAGMYGSQLTMLTCSGDRTAHIWRLNIDQISERRREAGTENGS